jgi:hypothetical protein
VCIKLKQAPESLGRAYVPCLDIAGDLVVCPRDHKGRTVHTLIHVLVDILNGLYGYADLDINIRPVLLEEVRVIRDHLAVVADDLTGRIAWLTDRKRLAVISPAVLRIPVLADNCYSHKCL